MSSITRADRSRGSRRGKYEKRTLPVRAYVLHTTGQGPNRRFNNKREREKFGYKTPLDAAVRIYRDLMDAGPEIVVSQEGEAVRIAEPNECTWHVGSRGWRAYKSPRWARNPKYGWWLERWFPLVSPIDLGVWDTGSVNQVTRGIEVIPPPDNGEWSLACVAALSLVCRELNALDGRDAGNPTRLLTHSDVHPIKRTTRTGRPWDPSREHLGEHLRESRGALQRARRTFRF